MAEEKVTIKEIMILISHFYFLGCLFIFPIMLAYFVSISREGFNLDSYVMMVLFYISVVVFFRVNKLKVFLDE